MRSFTIASVVLAATAALASPLTGLTGRQSEIDTTFRFLGSVYCLVHTDETVYSGPCPVSQQVQLQFEGLTALTEVLGHSINVTRVPVSGPYGNYYVVRIKNTIMYCVS
jgi:hypothetical protein